MGKTVPPRKAFPGIGGRSPLDQCGPNALRSRHGQVGNTKINGDAMSDLAKRRAEAVADTINRIRSIEQVMLLSPETLEAIRAELIKLAAQKDFFRPEDFPGPEDDTGDRLYELSRDDNDRFALYLNRGSRMKEGPPHDHKTWAVIVGVEGEEHNTVYKRLDDGDEPGVGRIVPDWEMTVRPGTGICLMPLDIHSIRMEGPDVKMHLHMYGIAIPRMVNRIKFDMETNTTAKYPPHPDIRPVPVE